MSPLEANTQFSETAEKMNSRPIGNGEKEFDADARGEFVRLALHNWELDGAVPSDEMRADFHKWALGALTSDEVLGRTRARYGLP